MALSIYPSCHQLPQCVSQNKISLMHIKLCVLFEKYYIFYLTTDDNWGKLFCFTIEKYSIINYPHRLVLYLNPDAHGKSNSLSLKHQSLNTCSMRGKTYVFQ